jgi:hypothetical protein
MNRRLGLVRLVRGIWYPQQAEHDGDGMFADHAPIKSILTRTRGHSFAESHTVLNPIAVLHDGALFGTDATPILSTLSWGERAVAFLLDRLLWTPQQRGADARERVHYGPLDVEDLGRVYEALLELEPGITREPMCRLRRQKLEVVVPLAQGEKYRPTSMSEVESNLDLEEEDSNDLSRGQ